VLYQAERALSESLQEDGRPALEKTAPIGSRRYVDLFDLTDRVAIVTGGARGLGRGIAQRLLECGASVVIADRDREAGSRAADELRGQWPKTEFVACDVAQEPEVLKLVEEVVRCHERVDILVNNAGIFPSSPLLEMQTDELDAVLAIDLRAPFLLCREACNAMVARGIDGRVLNVASLNAFRARTAGVAHYDAAKAGLVALTRSLAIELGRHGIRVNAIAPGLNLTEGHREALGLGPDDTDEAYPRFFREWVRRLPLQRIGTPDDQATAAVFLVSDASAYITGQCLVVDGGASIV
jgi:2-deoxy-D-gluconate 3-dehydrogenase